MNELINLVIVPVVGVLGWVIREQLKQNKEFVRAIDGLSRAIAYCPTRKKNEQVVKYV